MQRTPKDPNPIPVDEETLARHAAFVRGVARSVVNGDADADDVAQEAWLSALKSHAAHDEAPRGWFATIVRRRGADRARREARRRAGEAGAASRKDLPGPAEIAQVEEMRSLVVKRVLALEEPYRSAVLLRHYHGLSVADAAEALGVPLETCRTRLRRGLARLRMQFEQDGTRDDPRRRGALIALGGLTPMAASLPVALVVITAVLLIGVGGFLTWRIAEASLSSGGASSEGAKATAAAADDTPGGAAPGLAGRADDSGTQPAAEPTKPAESDGVRLEGKIVLPDSAGDGPIRITIATKKRGGIEETVEVSAGEAHAVRIDVTSLLGKASERLPVRGFVVRVDHPDCMPAEEICEVTREVRTVLHDGVGKAAVGLDVTLEPATCRVEGRVELPEGFAHTDGAVALFTEHAERPEPEEYVGEASLAEDGSFVLRAPKPGRHVLGLHLATPEGAATRPESVFLNLTKGINTVPAIRPSPGLELVGRVETPARLERCRFGVQVSLAWIGRLAKAWKDIVWVKGRFEIRWLRLRLGNTQRLRIAGLGPYPYQVKVQDKVWVDGEEVDSYLLEDAAEGDALRVTAPADDVVLSLPYRIWLLEVARADGGPLPGWIGVPSYATNNFYIYDVEPDGRLAAIVPAATPEKPMHPFLSPYGVRTQAEIEPGRWNRVEFPKAPTPATVEVRLLPPFANQTEHFSMSFTRKAKDGSTEWMGRPFGAARRGNILEFPNLDPGTWEYELAPMSYPIADLSAHFVPVQGTIELKPGERHVLDMKPKLGGFIRVHDIRKLGTSLGLPVPRLRHVDSVTYGFRVLDSRGVEQSVRATWHRDHDPGYASPRRGQELKLFGHNTDRRLTFWPALPPGEYIVELWVKTKPKEPRKQIRAVIQAGKDAVLDEQR